MSATTTINTSTLSRTFADEFNNFSASPDGSTGLWQTTLTNGGRTLGGNGEKEYYSDSSVGVNPFSIQNGILDITAAPGSNPLGLPYTSGVITTQGSFNQLYGYFEIMAKLPAGQGLWPAFWLLPASGAWPPELDVFEVLGNAPTTLYFSTHSSVQATQGTTLAVSNVSAGYNLYGVMWGPQTVDLYINNVKVASMPTPADMHVPMYMLANLAVGGYWPGVPNSTTPFPANMLIDYVHAYAYPGTAGGTVYDTLPSQNIGAAPVAPVISTPGTLQATSGTASPVPGVSIAANWPGGNFTVVLSDSHGFLNTRATSDVFASGENTTSLTLTGKIGPINAALATLTYQGSTIGSDWIWINATDPQQQQSVKPLVASVVATTTPLALAIPVNFTVAANASLNLPGITIVDTQSSNVTVVLSDISGSLQTAVANGVTILGQGTKTLTLSGSLAAINADLGSLAYHATTASGTDVISITATDAAGNQAVRQLGGTVTAPPVTALPVVTTPSVLSLSAGGNRGVSGISVADTLPNGIFSVRISDSFGVLRTTTVTGVTRTGEGTTSLALTGSLAAINKEVAGLIYQAGASAGTDWLWVSANDANGNQGINHVVVTVAPTPVVTSPAALILSASSVAKLPGVSVFDSQPIANLTVRVSDTFGLLRTNTMAGVTAIGEGTTSLALTGSLAAINAALVSLTYQAGAAAGSDWLWISANDANGGQVISHVVVTTTAAPAAPATAIKAAAPRSSATSAKINGVTIGLSNAPAFLTANVSDKTGYLATAGGHGIAEKGQGTTHLTLTGSLANVNAALATLTYTDTAPKMTGGFNDILSLSVTPLTAGGSVATGSYSNTTIWHMIDGHFAN